MASHFNFLAAKTANRFQSLDHINNPRIRIKNEIESLIVLLDTYRTKTIMYVKSPSSKSKSTAVEFEKQDLMATSSANKDLVSSEISTNKVQDSANIAPDDEFVLIDGSLTEQEVEGSCGNANDEDIILKFFKRAQLATFQAINTILVSYEKMVKVDDTTTVPSEEDPLLDFTDIDSIYLLPDTPVTNLNLNRIKRTIKSNLITLTELRQAKLHDLARIKKSIIDIEAKIETLANTEVESGKSDELDIGDGYHSLDNYDKNNTTMFNSDNSPDDKWKLL
jgi:hypothetical protein